MSAMPTGLQLMIAAGILVAGGVALLIWQLAPAQPDLANALERLSPRTPLRPDPTLEDDSTAGDLTGRLGRLAIRRLPARAWGRVPHRELRLLRRPLSVFYGQKILYASSALVLIPAMAWVFSLTFPIPLIIPTVGTLAAAAGMWFVPNLDVALDAKEARTDFNRALGAYIDLVALERNAGAGPRQALENAAASGLSRPTVSKYFDNPESVKPSTRARIEKALKDYDYRPNIFAVSMNRKKPKNIGLIVPHISDPFYAEIVRQIEMRCLAEGYWTIVLSSHGERKLEARAMRTLLSLNIAGVLMAPLGFDTDARLLENLANAMPIVFLDNRIGGDQPFVGTDNRQSIDTITEYLCRTGEHPSFLEMPLVNQNAIERRNAYIAAMERLKLEPITLPIPEKSWTFEQAGYEAASQILDRGDFPTRTVLCANDRLAFGVISAAFERRRRVGRDSDSDLRVAGHDDHPLSRFTCPPLTTVAQNYQGIAAAGIDMLFERIGERPAKASEKRLDARLIMRHSA